MIQRMIEKYEKRPVKEILVEMYVEKNMSIREIATNLNVSVGWVHSTLHKYNISKEKLFT